MTRTALITRVRTGGGRVGRVLDKYTALVARKQLHVVRLVKGAGSNVDIEIQSRHVGGR